MSQPKFMISLHYPKVLAKALISLLPLSILALTILVPNPKPIQAQEYTSFSQWCQNKNQLSLEARHTIEVMLWHTRTNVCEKAELILRDRNSLELGKSQIVDLRPLSSLQNLRTLDLANNQIVDVSPIASLKNLHFLNLSSNRIVDVAPLANLSELTILSFPSNRVTDVSSLRALQKLEILRLSDNPLQQKICPIANQSACQF